MKQIIRDWELKEFNKKLVKRYNVVQGTLSRYVQLSNSSSSK